MTSRDNMALVYNNLALATLTGWGLLLSVYSMDISVTPRSVRPNDKNVVFTCKGEDDRNRMSENMILIKLMKLTDDYQWRSEAVFRSHGPIQVTDENATADGRLGSVPDSYLAVTWPLATEHINGRYRCDGTMLTADELIVKEKSRVLDAKVLSSNESKSLGRTIISDETLVDQVNEAIHGAIESSNTNLIAILDSKFEELKQYFDDKTAVNSRRSKGILKLMSWPAGAFTFVMPETGCPKHPEWVKSYFRFKAVSSKIHYPDHVSWPFAKQQRKDGFIYRSYCSLLKSSERTKPWPAGSYCLAQLGGGWYCPEGFNAVVSYSKMSSVNMQAHFINDSVVQLADHSKDTLRNFFCCRHDGYASIPINLPVSHPFYLYRRGGRCQEVNDMNVSQDNFMMGTLDDDEYEGWNGRNADFPPDVTFNPYKEELCYYTKKKC